MGKDREGKFHPTKGKPSDTSKEGTELQEMMGTDVHVRHPNRQTHKGKKRSIPVRRRRKPENLERKNICTGSCRHCIARNAGHTY